MKHLGVELEQLTVPDRLHGGRPPRARQERELADRGAGPELAHGAQAVLLFHENTKPPAANEIHAIRRISLPNHDLAGVHLDRSKALRELGQRLLVGAGEKREVREKLVLGADLRRDAHVVRCYTLCRSASATRRSASACMTLR